MTWEDALEQDVDGFFELAVEVKYTPATVVASTAYPKYISALVYESGDLGIQDDHPIYDKMGIVVMRKEVEKPSYRDTFVIKNSSDEEETWYMIGYLGGGDRNKTWSLELARSTGH